MRHEFLPDARALLQERRLKARLDDLERARFAPLAVIGLACRVPDEDSAANGVDEFDASAFGFREGDAAAIEPPERVLLEVVWEALAHAGCAPDRLSGSQTGVFVGIADGSSTASGRVSALLDLEGPSISVDTASSGSLVAVHLACGSLRSRACEVAIAGGVGTGCGIVVLKRLADARRDGDRVLAVIRGTACGREVRQVVQSALTNAAVAPEEVSHLETHGAPNCDLAGGVAALIRTVMALQQRTIPASPSGVPMVAGVSAFGDTGTNVHVVLEEATAVERLIATTERPIHLLALGASSDAGLRRAARELATYVDGSDASIVDICFSVNTGRPALAHRAVVCAADTAELSSRLRHLAAGTADTAVRAGVAAKPAPRVVWHFPDGIQNATARDVYATNPTFRTLFGACGPTTLSAEAFAIQYGLAMVCKSMGLAPDVVTADGAGQLAAAVVTGNLSFEDALKMSSNPAGSWIESVTARTDAPRSIVIEFGPARSDRQQEDQRLYLLSEDGRNWQALAAAISELFVRGVAIDWRGFDRDQSASRVDVPGLPWMRGRDLSAWLPRVQLRLKFQDFSPA